MALVASMRKLLGVLIAMLKHDCLWGDKIEPAVVLAR